MGKASNTNDREQYLDEFFASAEARKIPLRELIAIRTAAKVIEAETDTLVSAAGYARIRALIEAAHKPSTVKARPREPERRLAAGQ